VAKRPTKARSKAAAGVPSPEQILEFVSSQPGHMGKREIARAFGIKGAARIELKQLLRRMVADGQLQKDARKLAPAGELAPVSVIEVVGQDLDGELHAVPASWNEAESGPAPRIVVIPEKTDLYAAPGVGERLLARLAKTGDTGADAYAYEARVIRRLTAARQTVLGVFRKSSGGAGRIVPIEKKARNDLEVAAGDDGGALSGELVAAEIVRDRGRGLVRARVRERLGSVDDQRAISLIAIHAHGIPNRFSEAALAETEGLEPATIKGREDFRRVPLITIDPPDARDHDDAVWAEHDSDPANPGGFRAIVAIADVAHYVRPGTSLDRDALERGNSTYFPDRVVPMLPERISTDLCSLRPNEDRAALAVTMVIDKSGRKLSHAFARVMMRSAAKLSYEQAQAAIDGRTDDTTGPLLEPVLKPLWAAWRALAKARDKRAPLELDLPERKIRLDEAGHVASITVPERIDSQRLIEEFMIQANVAAAETLEQFRAPLLYRVHDSPSPEKLRALAEFLATLDIKLARGNAMKPKDFNIILGRVRDTEVQQLVSDVVLRSQAQAVYAPENLGHFGLNLRRYAHFTSPIRRYADLIVHRSLIRVLGFGKDGLDDASITRLDEIGEQVSNAERRSMVAERDTIDRLVAAHLSGRVGASFQARISGLARAGLFVRLAETGADGFVPAASLGRDYFVHDEHRHALIGQHTGETYRLGDPVEVRLVEVTPLAGGLRFEVLSEGTPGKPAGGRRPPPRAARAGPSKRRGTPRRLR
jgi:ribonuclease R